MLANLIKKGARVQMKNGWFGTMADNAKGNIRMVDVEGTFRETGSVYSHDIARVKVGETWEQVELSPAQQKVAQSIRSFGF